MADGCGIYACFNPIKWLDTMYHVSANNQITNSFVIQVLEVLVFIQTMLHGMKMKAVQLYSHIVNGEGDSKAVTEFVIICATLMFGGYILGTFIDVMPTLNTSNPFASVMERLYEVIGSGYTLMIIVVIIIAGMILMWYLNRM